MSNPGHDLHSGLIAAVMAVGLAAQSGAGARPAAVRLDPRLTDNILRLAAALKSEKEKARILERRIRALEAENTKLRLEALGQALRDA